MRVLLDTCVIYPSILRSILLGVANEGLFSPLWSERIIDEDSPHSRYRKQQVPVAEAF